MTTKRIVTVIMCVMLVLTVVIAAVVVGKFAPILSVLTKTPEQETPSSSQTPPDNDEDEEQNNSSGDNTLGDNQTHTHEFLTINEQVSAACEKPGYTIYSCECGQTKIETSEALKHDYGVGKLVSPTCDAVGYTAHTCKICSYVDKQEIKDALGHQYSTDGVVFAATCLEAGYTEYKCTNAGCSSSRRVAGENKLGHSFGQWEVTTNPQEGMLGVETRSCTNSNCAVKETRDTELFIPAVGGITKEGHVYTINFASKGIDAEVITVYASTVTDEHGFLNMSIEAHFQFNSAGVLQVIYRNSQGGTVFYDLQPGMSIIIDADGNPTVPGT